MSAMPGNTPYDLTAGLYDSLYGDEQRTKYKYIEASIPGIFSEDLLDIGCGTALLLEYLKDMGRDLSRYMCLDPSEGMLHIASKRGDYRSIFVMGLAEDLPLRDSSFSRVLAITVWENITGKSRALEEALRVLGSPGVAIFSKHSRTSVPPPSSADPSFKYLGECIDEFYVYTRGSTFNFKNGVQCIFREMYYQVEEPSK